MAFYIFKKTNVCKCWCAYSTCSTIIKHLRLHFKTSESAYVCVSLCLPTVHCEERQTGYGSIFTVGNWHEPERDDLKPPGADPTLQQRNPRGGRRRGARAKKEKVQADGGG